MNDDYLWNRDGEPDEEIVRLEQLLGRLRYQRASVVVPGRFPKKPAASRWLALAAVFIVGLGLIPMFWRPAPLSDWKLANGNSLRTGQTLETGSSTGAAIESQFTGHVDIEPDSKLRLITSAEKEQRFTLEQGTIHALIWAPPGRFVVDTPSARTTDLGCRYTLRVDRDGTGLVTVETGWVAFGWQQRESFIPAGASCITRPKRGPGTPWFSDAPEALKKAVNAFDQTPGQVLLSAVLASARARDAITVWHVMVRSQGDERGEAFDRLAALVTMPVNISREAVVRGDPNALDGAWNALGLGSTEWWREWKRKW